MVITYNTTTSGQHHQGFFTQPLLKECVLEVVTNVVQGMVTKHRGENKDRPQCGVLNKQGMVTSGGWTQ